MRKQQSKRSISIQMATQKRPDAAWRMGAGSRRAVLRLAYGIASLAVVLSATVEASEIVITVAGPASGPHSDRTQQMLAGARRAAADVNANGGIKGTTVRIDSADDGCATEPAKATATALTISKIDLVIGHPCASAANAAATIYGNAQTLFIATGTRHHSFKRAPSDITTFRLSGRDDVQGETVARYLAEHYKDEVIAIVHDRTASSNQLADDAIATLKKLGAKPPVVGTVVGGDKDFPILTAKIKAAAAVFYAGYPIEAGMLYAQLRQAGSKAAFLMSDSSATDEFAETFGARAQGALVLRPRFTLSDDSATPSQVVAVEARIARADEALTAAAVTAYAAAANRAGSINAPDVARELSARAYETPDGVVDFDTNGVARRPSFDVYRWSGTTWEAADVRPLNP